MTTLTELNEQMKVRVEKISQISNTGQQPYAERYERTHSLSEALTLADDTAGVRVAGRVVSLRYFGKLAFGHLYDINGKLQFALQKKKLGELFAQFKELVDIGDFIGIEGQMMTTKTGEKTIDVHGFTFLSKALRPLPEKFHGLTDPELRLRRRYLDLVMNEESRERFKKRTHIIRTIRTFLDENEFFEIDTPVLTNKASGALARPFITHNNALDIDVYLRIAPETYLKRAIAGGFDRVYEFARSFRNEGVDASHLPDFTLLEYYCAYWNYVDNMNFTEKLIKHLLNSVMGTLEITYEDRQISFDGTWPRVSFRDLILNDCGIDIDQFATKEDLHQEIERQGITLETDVDISKAGRGTLIDLLYKKVSRPKLINPVFITHHPLDLSPLARKSDANPSVVDRFQLVVNGWEVVNAYSELVDPLDQAQRFKQQAEARAHGDTETMDVDNDFLTCMEYGMPPISGWGMGIDRIIALLTNTTNLRDVILFPLLRPEV
ncbi:lysine--tRNA ligase [Chitinispirillales bacterium ANBcel5]|uniref:lysine--tRNA ligase n=1 Tax=Cellulosispirillum alkaliphilum TaxID=3039283 RepID=UPI002A58EE9F|nr:lysine--tRNA ligase [Chitinispirillales bacterium ANBcel5]